MASQAGVRAGAAGARSGVGAGARNGSEPPASRRTRLRVISEGSTGSIVAASSSRSPSQRASCR